MGDIVMVLEGRRAKAGRCVESVQMLLVESFEDLELEGSFVCGKNEEQYGMLRQQPRV